jgi:hypothetical protein
MLLVQKHIHANQGRFLIEIDRVRWVLVELG